MHLIIKTEEVQQAVVAWISSEYGLEIKPEQVEFIDDDGGELGADVAAKINDVTIRRKKNPPTESK